MLATLVLQPFQRPGWVYEEKYDGIPILAYKEGERDQRLFATEPVFARGCQLSVRARGTRTLARAVLSRPREQRSLGGDLIDRAGIRAEAIEPCIPPSIRP